MKTLLNIVAALALFLSACTTQYQSRATYDDIYYSPKDAPVVKAEQPAVSPTQQENQVISNNSESYTQAAEPEQEYSQQAEEQTYQQEYYTDENGNYLYADSEQYTDPATGNTYVTNNYYDADDY